MLSMLSLLIYNCVFCCKQWLAKRLQSPVLKLSKYFEIKHKSEYFQDFSGLCKQRRQPRQQFNNNSTEYIIKRGYFRHSRERKYYRSSHFIPLVAHLIYGQYEALCCRHCSMLGNGIRR